jgi:hypothetical protein
MREVKIEKAGNGYIVKFLDFSGGVSVFKTFAEMMDFLFDHFDEQKAKA